VIKKTIKYTDFNDEEISQDFYFHLSKAELVELELSHQGGLSESMKRIIVAQDGDVIMAEFKKIILMSYGVRSVDGRKFTKNPANLEDFVSSGAYSALFMELVTDTDAMIEFVNGIVPSGLSEEAARRAGIDSQKTPLVVVETEDKAALGNKVTEVAETKDPTYEVPEPEVVTKAQIIEMPAEELQHIWDRVRKGEVIIQG